MHSQISRSSDLQTFIRDKQSRMFRSCFFFSSTGLEMFALPFRSDPVPQRSIVDFLLINRHHVYVTAGTVSNDSCMHSSFADAGILKHGRRSPVTPNLLSPLHKSPLTTLLSLYRRAEEQIKRLRPDPDLNLQMSQHQQWSSFP